MQPTAYDVVFAEMVPIYKGACPYWLQNWNSSQKRRTSEDKLYITKSTIIHHGKFITGYHFNRYFKFRADYYSFFLIEFFFLNLEFYLIAAYSESVVLNNI